MASPALALPRHNRGPWVGPGRRRKAAGPGQHGVIDLSPCEFLDRLADLVPPPRTANPVFARLTPRPAGQTVEGGTGSGWPAAGMAGRLLRHS
ncbi:MAG: hypothetical protein LW698_14555, partial [Planctomycetaceae bacterium]|nr:hypothetical protein [Planctomycetaceae bacterium]